MQQEESLKIPRDIKIAIKAKIVEVTGKNGTIRRDFKHLPIELRVVGHEVRAKMYFAKTNCPKESPRLVSVLVCVESHCITSPVGSV